MSDTPPEPFTITSPFVARLMIGFVAALAAIAAFAAHDRSQRGALERMGENTAVGDGLFCVLATDPAKQPVFQLNGKAVRPMNTKKIGIRDARLTRAGKDPASGVYIYTAGPQVLKGQEVEPVTPGHPLYFLKIGMNQYVQAKVAQ